MKKTLSILCVFGIVLSCAVLTGCGDKGKGISPDSKYIGTWQAVKAEFKGEETDIHEILSDEFILKLNQDGTATVKTEGEEHLAPWSETNSEIQIKSDDINLKLKKEDRYLTMSILGVSIFFDKQN